MSRFAAVAACVFVLTGCAPALCPTGQARDNGGQCVVIAPPAPPAPTANVFDQFDGQAPSKDEYVADEGIVLSDEAIARINANNEAERVRHRAERAVDDRADRIVEAERATQAELKRIGDKLD